MLGPRESKIVEAVLSHWCPASEEQGGTERRRYAGRMIAEHAWPWQLADFNWSNVFVAVMMRAPDAIRRRGRPRKFDR